MSVNAALYGIANRIHFCIKLLLVTLTLYSDYTGECYDLLQCGVLSYFD